MPRNVATTLQPEPPIPIPGRAAAGSGVPPLSAAARDAFWLGVGLLALVAWDASGVDLPIARLFGEARGFPWRDQWFVAEVLHAGARWPAWTLGVLLAVNVWRPFTFARNVPRSQRVRWLAATLTCAALIPLLKLASLTSCPWSLAEFGGTASYVSHWSLGVNDGGPGRCFPAGHATVAFCFLSGYFALRGVAPRAARVWLLATLVAGLAATGVQAVRGAHFVSHSLWTAWWCWLLTLAFFHGSRSAGSDAR